MDRLTQGLLERLDRDAEDHLFEGSDAHLGECLACLDRFVVLRDDMHAVATAKPVSRHLVRKLGDLLGRQEASGVWTYLPEHVRRVFSLRVPAWTMATAVALVALAWATTTHLPVVNVDWPLGASRPDRLTPAHRQGTRTVTGVVSSIRDARSNGVDAHVLSLTDPSGSTYVLFAWGPPSVGPGDTVEIEALFTSVPQATTPVVVYQGVVTALRRAK